MNSWVACRQILHGRLADHSSKQKSVINLSV
jgi:hypothetical protein